MEQIENVITAMCLLIGLLCSATIWLLFERDKMLKELSKLSDEIKKVEFFTMSELHKLKQNKQ